ncbi:lipopolysaccharide biosynthesis protein [Aliiglaciecola sp. 2_MG-2023]|uniref:lipopolysaccharide biosynthesis protein n=1 Tax=unclassified Aliiglaciecola TaxID=2593648 RepID=UPI0026E3CA97|nr:MULTISPECIES: lipopolysaccharide biosynthesis protein [unclassified Aliiglaciecola]MDO6709102.1 lipopolysaccharide biosynthesis protein [Aliiglaciecola sp. 2_MG-2023]MDO6750250.1 lipopolysaccharide biosynthesis protein [Aliiglaciecola sp. 1_MG-2023]
MTKQAQLELEQRFEELKALLSNEQWSDADFLNKKVEELEFTDVALAFRLMQRVKNLDPSETNQNKLKELRGKALQEVPELATLSSTESNNRKTMLQNALSLKEQIAVVFAHPQLQKFKRPLVLCVFLPFVLFAFYQVIWASPRYESQAKLIVKEPDGMATLDPAMALMSGFGVGSASLDTELVKAFIYSNDMLTYLENTLDISSHYSNNTYDMFSRLDGDASRETTLKYYLDRVLVELDEKSQVINIYVQAFEPDFAHLMSKTIVDRAEWYINEIGHNLAKKQLEFVMLEHQLVEKRLQKAKTELLAFQRRHNLLDPQAEGMALQQITYQMEGQVAAKRTELNALRNSMSENAPQVIQARSQLESMLEQLENERSRLTSDKSDNNSLPEDEQNLSVSQIMAKFSDYKINMELALQAYTSSQVSLEKSRIEAYRQLKYLVTVESPTSPQDAKYPEVFYNLSLFLAITLMLFGIGRIVIATVAELR